MSGPVCADTRSSVHPAALEPQQHYMTLTHTLFLYTRLMFNEDFIIKNNLYEMRYEMGLPPGEMGSWVQISLQFGWSGRAEAREPSREQLPAPLCSALSLQGQKVWLTPRVMRCDVTGSVHATQRARARKPCTGAHVLKV